MANMKMVIAAVAAVAVIVVAGVAVMMNNGPNNGDDDKLHTGVFGNANDDNKIDSADLDIIDKIIAGTLDFKDYPYADANHDGKVDSADYGLILDFIDHKNVTLYVKDSSKKVVPIHYPINGVFATGGTNSRVCYQVLDMEDMIVANATTDEISPVLDKKLYDLKQNNTIKTVSTSGTDADFTELSKLHFSLAILEFSGANATYLTDKSYKWFADFGINTLSISVDNFYELRDVITTLGILVGSEAQAKQYSDLLDKVMDNIKTKVGDKYGTRTIMDVVMTNSVSGTSADYYNLTVLAGGKNLADFPQSTKKFNPAEDPWLYADKYNPEVMVHYKSMTYGEAVSPSDISDLVKYFKDTKAFQNDNYYLINGTVPLPARLAFTACVMYPTQLGADWYLDIFQEYFDTFCDYPGWNVKNPDYKVTWNTEELKAILNA